MAINSTVQLEAIGEFADFRQEFIVKVGVFGALSTFYVSRDQMMQFIANLQGALAQASKEEREAIERMRRDEEFERRMDELQAKKEAA